MSKPSRVRYFKAGLSGLSGRKLTVGAFRFGSQVGLELRVLDQVHNRDLDLSLSIPQARQALRLLSAAIEAAETASRHDGPQIGSVGRAPAGGDQADGQGAI